MRLASLLPASITALICFVCLLVVASPAGAAVMVFNDGAIHTVNTSILPDSIEIRGTTTVNVAAGAMIGTTSSASVSVFDTAHLNMTGGDLSDELFLNNNSTGVVSGGHIVDDITTLDSSSVIVNNVVNDDDLEARGNSLMTINGGSHDEDIESFDTATVNIHGGTFQTGMDGADVEAAGNSRINIFGGSFGTGQTNNAGAFNVLANGTINFHGGNIGGQPQGLTAAGNGVINVYGFSGQPTNINTTGNGKIIFHDGPLQNLVAHGSGVVLAGTDGSLANITADDSSVLRILGSNFKALNGAINLPYGPISLASGNLSGVLADGTSFTNVPFSRILAAAGGTRGIIILAAIPEPGSLALVAIALAGLMAGRWRRSQA